MNHFPSITFSGDIDAGKKLIKLGLRQLEKLDEYLGFNNLEIGTTRRNPLPGVVIVTHRAHGLGFVKIFVSPEGGGGSESHPECLCNCNFTHGYIKKVKPDKLDEFWQLYDVSVCTGKRTYTLHEDVLASDFTVYEEMQKVLLIPYNTMKFSCCESGGGASGCAPKKSEEDIQSDDWRTTLRIIPWCAFSLPKWVQVKNHG